MKKGTSNVLWLLGVAVLAIFILLVMSFMTQGKTNTFSDFASDTFGRFSEGLLGFGEDGEGTESEDKGTLSWIVNNAESLCQSEEEKGFRTQNYTFSDELTKAIFDNLEEEEGNFSIFGFWDRPKRDEQKEFKITKCRVVEMSILKDERVSGGTKYNISVIGVDQKSVKIKFKNVDSKSEGNKNPVAKFETDCSGLKCTFTADQSHDPDGNINSYKWDLNGNGEVDKETNTYYLEHSYDSFGDKEVVLKAVDSEGAEGSVTKTIDLPYPQPEAVIDCKGVNNKGEEIGMADIDKGNKLICDAGKSKIGEGAEKGLSYRWNLIGLETKEDLDGERLEYRVPENIDKKKEVTVSLKVRNKGGKEDTAEMKTVIGNLPPEPALNYEIKSYTNYKQENEYVKGDWTVQLDASGSSDPDGEESNLEYSWKVNGETACSQKVCDASMKAENNEITLIVSDGVEQSTKKEEINYHEFPAMWITNAKVEGDNVGVFTKTHFTNLEGTLLYSHAEGEIKQVKSEINVLGEGITCKKEKQRKHVTERHFGTYSGSEDNSIQLWWDYKKLCDQKKGKEILFDVDGKYEIKIGERWERKKEELCLKCPDADDSRCSVSLGACEENQKED